MLENMRDDREALKIIEMLVVIPPDGKFDYATFTCKYWNRETKLCMNYENRPFMCSDYPYDSTCIHCGATSKANADENYQTDYPSPKIREFVEVIGPK